MEFGLKALERLLVSLGVFSGWLPCAVNGQLPRMDVEVLPPVLLPILAPTELCNLLGFSLSNKATAHEGILSTPRDFKNGFSSSLTSP